MTAYELAEKLGALIRTERKITNEILQLLARALDTRAYLELGYSSLFDWLTRGFGYSNAAAYRRIEAARLLRSVPTLSEKLESGQTNLTNVSKLQTAIKQQERKTGQRLPVEQKLQLVKQIETKSTQETEKIIAKELQHGEASMAERRQLLDENSTRLTFCFNPQDMANLNRAKELLSHKFPNARDGEILAHALTYLIEHEDPLRKITKSFKKNLIKAADACCTYRDPLTGVICGSRYQVQIDHIIPKARGGTDEPGNLRILCRQHNLLMAEKLLGKGLMEKCRQ